MYLKAKSYKKVFKYDLINTLKFIHRNDIKINGKYSKNVEQFAMVASKHNSINVLKYLIDEMSLDVSFNDDHILKVSLFYNNYEMADYIIDRGANIQNCQDNMIDTCYTGDYGLAKYMFDKGFDIKGIGSGCIIAACENGHLTLLEMFIKHGAQISNLMVNSLKPYADKKCYKYLMDCIHDGVFSL